LPHDFICSELAPVISNIDEFINILENHKKRIIFIKLYMYYTRYAFTYTIPSGISSKHFVLIISGFISINSLIIVSTIRCECFIWSCVPEDLKVE
jgi:hypothetical protein